MVDKTEILLKTPQWTVINEYKKKDCSYQKYQTEAELEQRLIELLQSNGYEYKKNLTNEADLIKNLRAQLEKLNKYQFTDKEWDHLFTSYLADKRETIEEKTEKIQKDFIFFLTREDGTKENIYLIDKKNIQRNRLQVINQYKSDGEKAARYDVTILVNGLPLVHIELKRRGVAIREAFNQIGRYHRSSFNEGHGLFQYIQLFIISNGTSTKYYSNTVRKRQIEKDYSGKQQKAYAVNSSFAFTNWWADQDNNRIDDLEDFAQTFLTRHTLLNILIHYCIFTEDKRLLAMRPYQITATEKILNKLQMATNNKRSSSPDCGGYIWHATGSGKTLTSFKTAQRIEQEGIVKKVIFVVDRKDLDHQTIKEYENYQKGAVNASSNTKELEENLQKCPQDCPIVLTTIQKLSRFIKKDQKKSLYSDPVVFIFDECHRSQFGKMHKQIKKAFKNHYFFGFTGTPIFKENANYSNSYEGQTTEMLFGNMLHSYSIIDAIKDKNVLPFHVEYFRTSQNPNQDAYYEHEDRIKKVVKYIIEHFDQKTGRSSLYGANRSRRKVFNSLLAASSIKAAQIYYDIFKTEKHNLKIGLIYSFNENNDEDATTEDFDMDLIESIDSSSRNFLEKAITDYNELFGTNYDTSAEKFSGYYKDVSSRLKEGELDILIVVNMFLTGFDAPSLNTLWLDKKLQYHGLIQAFSRTNRILNDFKQFGNIISFRDLEKETREAIQLFGNEKAETIIFIRSYEDYYKGWTENDKTYDGYKTLITKLRDHFSIEESFRGEEWEKEFINLWGKILKRTDTLERFDSFKGDQVLLSDREFQDYQSRYLDLYDKFRRPRDDNNNNIQDGISFEVEFIKAIDIDYDYLYKAFIKYKKAKNQKEKRKQEETILKDINATHSWRNKTDLIKSFLEKMNDDDDNDKNQNISLDMAVEWRNFVTKEKEEGLKKIITTYNLKEEPTKKFIEQSFIKGKLETNIPSFQDILPKPNLFDKEDFDTSEEKHPEIEGELNGFFDRYWDL